MIFSNDKPIYIQMADQLAREEVIYNKRGLGYFVTPGAKKQILKVRKQEFMKEKLPELFRQMQLLGITLEDVKDVYDATLKDELTSNK